MKKKNGWILPDAMIGVAITVTALVAIIVLYTQVTSSTIVARDYQNATYIAQRKLENLRQYDNTGVIKNLSESIKFTIGGSVQEKLTKYLFKIKK